MKVFGVMLTIVLIVGGILGFAMWVDKETPNSTEGVSVVDGNTARLPQDGVFILTHQIGKVRNVWDITYDGKDTVRLHCQSLFCSDFDPVILCGVGCKVKVEAGLLEEPFVIWLREDGAVNVKWPQGWTYRPYQSTGK